MRKFGAIACTLTFLLATTACTPNLDASKDKTAESRAQETA